MSYFITEGIISSSEARAVNNQYVIIVDRKRTNQLNLRIFCHVSNLYQIDGKSPKERVEAHTEDHRSLNYDP